MQKAKYLLLFLGLFTIILMKSKAETISYKRLNNINYYLNVNGKTSSNHVTMFYLDDKLAYCIEPGKDINTKTYTSQKDWQNINISKENQEYIEKVGYFGYEYPGHQTDKYYIATQELIWMTFNKVSITWKDDNGNIINTEKEKKEIINLINKYDKGPSFINNQIEGKENEIIKLEDTNNSLNNYEITSKNIKLNLSNNTLFLTLPNQEEEDTINFKSKTYDKQTIIIYTYGNSQKLASLRLSFPKEFNLKVKTIKEKQPEKPKEKIIIKKEIVQVPNTYKIKEYKKQFNKYQFNDTKFN